MNTLLWTLQMVLGIVFILHGYALVAWPKPMRPTFEKMPYSRGFLGFIGVMEVLGGVGLIVPWWTGILPWLTPLAAVGIALIMAGAANYHFGKREIASGLINSVVVLLLAAVAFFRW